MRFTILLLAFLVGFALASSDVEDAQINPIEEGENAVNCDTTLDATTEGQEEIVTGPIEPIEPETTEPPVQESETTEQQRSETTESVSAEPSGDELIVRVVDATAASDDEGAIAGASVSGSSVPSRTADESGFTSYFASQYGSSASISLEASADGFVASEEESFSTASGTVTIYLIPVSSGGYVATLQWVAGPEGSVEDYDFHIYCRTGPKGSGQYGHVFYKLDNREYSSASVEVTLDRDDRQPGGLETVQFKRLGEEDFCAISVSAFAPDPFWYYSTDVTVKLYYSGVLVDTLQTGEADSVDRDNEKHKLVWYINPGRVARRVNSDVGYTFEYSPNFDNKWIAGPAAYEDEFPYEDIDDLFAEYQSNPEEGVVVNEPQ